MIAATGKGKLNQLITFLDKTGNVKDGLGGRSDGSALRAVRSKREAEEAGMSVRILYTPLVKLFARQGISQRRSLARDTSIAKNQDSASRLYRESLSC
jgi:hypothetical protein